MREKDLPLTLVDSPPFHSLTSYPATLIFSPRILRLLLLLLLTNSQFSIVAKTHIRLTHIASHRIAGTSFIRSLAGSKVAGPSVQPYLKDQTSAILQASKGFATQGVPYAQGVVVSWEQQSRTEHQT